jgi:hypothetical protein
MKKVNSRRKGHDLERKVARDLQKIWPLAVTSRANSQVLDACGVDIDNVPFLIQCKSGYLRNRPKPELLFADLTAKVKEKFGKERAEFPPVLIHKMDARNPFNFLVTITYEEWLNLIANAREG